jgi:hypothetical protein
MSGLLLIGVVLLWFWAAIAIARMLTSKLKPAWVKLLVTFLAIAIIIPLPVADEIIGASIFYAECKKLTPVQFHGAASIGVGFFFDAEGNPRWTSDKEFKTIRAGKNGIDLVVGSADSKSIIHNLPIQIELTRSIFFEKRKKQLILETENLNSNGGWIRRMFVGFGGYSCRSSGVWPNEQSWIKF